MKKTSFILFCVLLFTSCNELEKKVQGGWVIDQAYYHNEPVRWDLYNNSLSLNKDNSCDLPPISGFRERKPEEMIGTWQAYTQNDTSYLQINSENWIFDRTFKINNFRKVRDSVSWGYIMKMTLTADSLKLDCTKALYE